MNTIGYVPPDRAIAQLSHHGLVPVVSLDDAANADDLAQALVDGGLPVAEITFRTAAAARSIEVLARRGDILVGAGTVLTVWQVDRAVAAGAAFVVSPGLSRAVVERCQAHHIAVLPGVATATEIQAAMELGLGAAKFFPAAAAGGSETVRALAAPFPGFRLLPTGGIAERSLAEYLSLPTVLAVGGSWMVPAQLIARGDFAAIRELTRAAVLRARQTSRPWRDALVDVAIAQNRAS